MTKIGKEELYSIYKRGDSVDKAFIINEGPVHVSIEGMPTQVIPADNVLVGKLEHVLEGTNKRLFDLSIESSEQVQSVDLSLVDEMIHQFHFGYNTNIFLARLIDVTNQYYLERQQELSHEFGAYETRAKQFTHLVNDAYRISIKHDLKELDSLIYEKKKLELYRDGVLYCRPYVMPTSFMGFIKASPFIERFKKNATICREGSTARKMYILLRGSVAVTTGKRYITSITSPGEVFGELALFLEGKRTATLIAEENTDVFVVKLDGIKKFHKNYPSFFLASAQTLAQRVCDNIEKITNFEDKAKALRGSSEIGRKEVEEFYLELTQMQKELKLLEIKELLENYSGAAPRN